MSCSRGHHLWCVFCSHAGRVIWKWWDYYLSSKSILSVLIRVGGLHFTLLAGMSLMLISKECICVCLCKLGICTILISDTILLWFLSALIYVICCYGYMYWLDSLPVSFLSRPVEGLCSSPLLFCCTTVLEVSMQHTGSYSSKLWLLSTPHYWLLKCIPSSWHVVSLVAYCVVYDEVEWTIAEVTTLDVFLFLCRFGVLAKVRLLLEFKANPECADNNGWTPLHHACRYVPGADY